MTGESTVILDPATDAAIAFISFSEDDKFIVYGMCTFGSYWTYIHILNMENLQHSPEILKKTKIESVAWTHDNLGFFYLVNISYCYLVV